MDEPHQHDPDIDDGAASAADRELLVSQVAVGALLFVSGIVGGVLGNQAWFITPAAKKVMMERGWRLPASMELNLLLQPWVLVPVVAVLATALVVGLAFLRKPALSWTVSACCLLLVFALNAFALLNVYLPTRILKEAIEADGEPPQPGRTSEIASDVAKAFRISVRRGVGSFQTPGGTTVYYMIYTGPGVDGDPPAALPPYAEARDHPGCLILPWGPAGNTDFEREVTPLFPTGEAGGVDPGACDDGARGAAWVSRIGNFAEQPDGSMTLRLPAVIEVPSSDGEPPYAYALELRRGRLDAVDQGAELPQRGQFPFTKPTRVGPEDPFRDDFYRVVIRVFRGYDADAAPSEGVLPESRVPDREFLTEVAR